MMPVMDGCQLCDNIKSDIRYSHIPVILLTAAVGIESHIKSLKSGADLYLEKPFKMESETADSISFRRRDAVSRLTKMCEDRITLSKTEEGYFLDGLRKDVFLYATGIEYSIPKEEGQTE